MKKVVSLGFEHSEIFGPKSQNRRPFVRVLGTTCMHGNFRNILHTDRKKVLRPASNSSVNFCLAKILSLILPLKTGGHRFLNGCLDFISVLVSPR
jgi:hypothetical protein